MSGKQMAFKAMNKGSWRMLQPCTIVAAVHRLNKTKNSQPKGSSQISICEGQVHLAGGLAQGHKKAQRCFIRFVPCLSRIQLTSEFFIANFLQSAIFQRQTERERIFPVKIKTRAQLCHPQWEIVPPFSPRAQSETSCLSQSIPLAHTAPCLWHKLHFSWHSMTQTKNFRRRKMDSDGF